MLYFFFYRNNFEANRSQNVPGTSEAKANYKFSSASSIRRKTNSSVDLPSPARDVPRHLYACDSDDDEYAYDFARPYFDNSVKTRNSVLRQKESKANLFTSIDEYSSSKNSFSGIFKKWLPERRRTLTELESLFEEVLSAQQTYNEAQANCKGVSAEMRNCVNRSETEAGRFLASFASFVTDAVSGIASFTQAFKVDGYQTKFQEIMDRDAEVTKELYETRSRCVARYQGIEEVMRKFHHDTFDSTVDKISCTLEVNKYWESMKNAYKNDDMETLLNTVGKFFDNACQSEVMDKIGNALDRYVSDNPAALEACKSTGKAVYGAVNTWGPEDNRKGVRGQINYAANGYLMLKDMEEADRFKSAAEDDCQGSKLVRQIRDARDSLQSELEEMNNIYLDLFKTERSRTEFYLE